MGVSRTVIQAGNGHDLPKKGDMVTIEYTGNLEDPSAPNGKGTQYVSHHFTNDPAQAIPRYADHA